ncbi:hypothetical protein WNY78_10310 [Psychroserpens sp. AS72]|uniref:hypothetical protein n=1 Tax=Psychroserpens sp. AS72 TaxID=3135775 RepID=UPI0031757641
MKTSILILFSILLMSCSSTNLVESWKNPDIDTYEPYKVLVIGLTSDEAARQQFEEKLQNELTLRGAEVVISLDALDQNSNNDMMTIEELDALENQLIEDGFDTILLTKIVGVENKKLYTRDYKNPNVLSRRFKDEYFKYQDLSYNPNFYEEYKIYKAETTMYCICPTKDRELIWKGYINITDPKSIEKTAKDYVKLVITVLEEQQLIKPLVITKDNEAEEL